MGRVYDALKLAEKEHHEAIIESYPVRRKGKVILPSWDVFNRNTLEHYEQLKANLLSSSPNRVLRTILFTSTSHGDGCSTTAINFANTLIADFPHKVLLVDANFRAPSLHKAVNADPSPGLSEFLQKRGKLPIFSKKIGGNNLFFVFCGGRHSRPVALFQTTRFTQFLSAMSDRFDYVILDGPPAGSFPESRMMASKVDAVVLVFEAGKTRRQTVIRTKEEIEKAGCKHMGMVMNRRKYHIPQWIYNRL